MKAKKELITLEEVENEAEADCIIIPYEKGKIPSNDSANILAKHVYKKKRNKNKISLPALWEISPPNEV